MLVVRFPITASNPCNSSPCGNGGTCTSFDTFFQCTCQPGYTGEVCQIEIGKNFFFVYNLKNIDSIMHQYRYLRCMYTVL